MHKCIETDATGTHHLLNFGFAMICSLSKSFPNLLSVKPIYLKSFIIEKININPNTTAKLIFCHKANSSKLKFIIFLSYK